MAVFIAVRHYALITHGDGSSQLRVTGQLVDSTDMRPVAGTFVTTAPSRSFAMSRVQDGSYRAQADDLHMYEGVEDAAGFDRRGTYVWAWYPGRTRTVENGTFSIVLTLLWSYNVTGGEQPRPLQPPPRRIVDALVVEIEGRDPVILDVPEGTWTQHDGEDDLWATWDLGVVEVPWRP